MNGLNLVDRKITMGESSRNTKKDEGVYKDNKHK